MKTGGLALGAGWTLDRRAVEPEGGGEGADGVGGGGAGPGLGLFESTTGGLPRQLLRLGGGSSAGLGAGAAPSAGSPGRPDPRGALTPQRAPARAWSRRRISDQSERGRAARVTLMRCRAVMLSEVMLPAWGPQPRLIEGTSPVE